MPKRLISSTHFPVSKINEAQPLQMLMAGRGGKASPESGSSGAGSSIFRMGTWGTVGRTCWLWVPGGIAAVFVCVAPETDSCHELGGTSSEEEEEEGHEHRAACRADPPQRPWIVLQS